VRTLNQRMITHATLCTANTFRIIAATRGATIVGEFVDDNIVGPTPVPVGARLPAHWHRKSFMTRVTDRYWD
jgi:hypothetical protein